MGTLVQSKQEIIDILSRHRVQLGNLGVEEIGLFGSFVRGQQRVDSDVDVLVRFNPHQKTFENLMRLSTLLEELLGRPVEVVTTEALSPYIGPHILHEVEYVDLAT
jgi:predicted nucleotidyltransferase